jgi:putative flavoprotein involved in K+ transport
VLVVGASATGVQLAEEIHASGRPVTLAVGRHQRLPRTYRGRDILWWLEAMGVFDDTVENVFDISTSRSQPSLQLVGSPDMRSIDLRRLGQQGVRILGRLMAIDHERAHFDDDLVATAAASDLKLAELLHRIDTFIGSAALRGVVPAEPLEPTWPLAMDTGAAAIDLQDAGIASVVWATGFTRRYPWLNVPALDEHGELIQGGGITPVPGLFVLGMHFQRRRNSAFIDGVGHDAAFLADRIGGREGVHPVRERHHRQARTRLTCRQR